MRLVVGGHALLNDGLVYINEFCQQAELYLGQWEKVPAADVTWLAPTRPGRYTLGSSYTVPLSSLCEVPKSHISQREQRLKNELAIDAFAVRQRKALEAYSDEVNRMLQAARKQLEEELASMRALIRG